MSDDPGGTTDRPQYHLVKVDDLPDGVDGRRANASLRIILEEINRTRDGDWYLIATYSTAKGARESARRLRKRYPMLTDGVELAYRTLRRNGESLSRLYARWVDTTDAAEQAD